MSHVSTVTIAASQVPADQTNFPVLLPTPPTDSAIWSDTTPSGGDIRIFASDGTAEWAREIVSFDATAKTCEIWVKVPFLSSSSDTVVQIHADGASSEPAFTDTVRGRNAVWADYKGVFHFAQTPTGASGDIKNSTGESDGTSVNMDSSNVVAGLVGTSALSFNGSNEYIDLGDVTWLDGSSAMTLKAVVKVGTAKADAAIIRKLASGQQSYLLGINSLNAQRFNLAARGSELFQIATNTNSVNPGQRQELSGVWPGGQDADLYLDGDSQSKDVLNGSDPGLINNSSERLAIGARYNAGSPDLHFDGVIDEVRISRMAFSSNWMSTEYNNQSAPNTFAAWVDEAAGAVPVLGAITATATTANSISFSIPVSY